jgi:hypothetical protein
MRDRSQVPANSALACIAFPLLTEIDIGARETKAHFDK